MVAETTRDDLDLIRQALSGQLEEDQKRIATAGLEIVATLIRKNIDYGSSAWEPPVLLPTMPPGQAMLVRLSDKVKRVASLSGGRSPRVAESLDETILDIAGYSILWLSSPERNGVSNGV